MMCYTFEILGGDARVLAIGSELSTGMSDLRDAVRRFCSRAVAYRDGR